VQIKVSSKGQIVLPVAIRKKLHIEEGDSLEILMGKERVVLLPKRKKKFKPRIVISTVTGLPVLTFGPDAPIITKEMVDKLLEDFP
jgi:AbrB family looped-hinge helix DNA binding protein